MPRSVAGLAGLVGLVGAAVAACHPAGTGAVAPSPPHGEEPAGLAGLCHRAVKGAAQGLAGGDPADGDCIASGKDHQTYNGDLMRTFVVLKDDYGGPVPSVEAMFDSARKRLVATYPTLVLPEASAPSSTWTLAKQLSLDAISARCALPPLAAADPQPEHVIILGVLEALAWQDSAIQLGTTYLKPLPRVGSSPNTTQLVKGPGRRLAGGVVYVPIDMFTTNVATKTRAAVTAEASPRGLILDLRDCPGGLLDAAIELADLFLRQGPIMTLRSRTRNEERRAHDQASDLDLPVVILVDAATASGAEVVVAALQHNDRALVVGATTFGAGIVKVAWDLPSGAKLFVPTAELVAADGKTLNGRGLAPDVNAPPVAGDADPAVTLAEKILVRSKGATRDALRVAAAAR